MKLNIRILLCAIALSAPYPFAFADSGVSAEDVFSKLAGVFQTLKTNTENIMDKDCKFVDDHSGIISNAEGAFRDKGHESAANAVKKLLEICKKK